MQDLKKISAKNQRRRTNGSAQCDVETLTDEELFATVDKDSGFIRFTLRKRRPTNSKEITLPVIDNKVGEQNSSAQSTVLQPIVDDTTNSRESGVTKRTKLGDKSSESEAAASRDNEEVDDNNKSPGSISDQVTAVTCPASSDGPAPTSRVMRKSTSSDVEMSTGEQPNSTCSSSSSTSTSSSKESIQSIVTLERRAELDGAAKLDDNGESAAADEEEKEDNNVRDAKREGTAQVEHSAGREEVQISCEKGADKAVDEAELSVAPKANESMVVRAARELEATMLRNQQRLSAPARPAVADRKPVAAVRRLVGAQKQQSSSATTSNEDSLVARGAAKEQQTEGSSQVISQRGARPIAVKSMCWPPKSATIADGGEEGAEQSSVGSSSQADEHRRMSLKKGMIEEQSATNVGCATNVASGAQRPRQVAGGAKKPLPPAKPAKLVAAAYVSIIQQQQQQQSR